MAREHAPSIIFMDEVDSIGSARMDNSSGSGDSEVQRTMLELLNQLDGFEATNKIKVHCSHVSSDVNPACSIACCFLPCMCQWNFTVLMLHMAGIVCCSDLNRMCT
jgi:SpoVK/Ycf46/Vps4 family AAA+-type ATPase